MVRIKSHDPFSLGFLIFRVRPWLARAQRRFAGSAKQNVSYKDTQNLSADITISCVLSTLLQDDDVEGHGRRLQCSYS
jgi:hypothetical protein